MRKLLLVFLVVLPCVVLAQNKKGKKTPKVIEWSDEEGTFRIYPNHVTVIGGGEYTAPKEEPKAKAKTEKTSQGAVLISGHKTDKVSKDCKCKDKVLKGRVKVVEYAPDYRVKVVNGVSDMRIKIIDIPPLNCGEWQFVEYAPDFTIQYVENAPDFTIKFVDYCPGVE